jgi:hypothetical protein
MLATIKLHAIPASLPNYLRCVSLRYLRLAPLYYSVFLFGWQIGPSLSSGPCWFTYEKGFATCTDYWWSVFTMTINFEAGGNTIANEGCFYWGWYPPCDLQIFVFLPPLVWAI